ncbi:hypothetical protein GOP47_0012901 [Adiantum capillus-veneris]|uniref:Uncharacterized protein n=1 Tax=Adiantum capillus-veneris TaxID=13818 RepID=A0A9D4URJ9_ADICA|nr:hypothetical protein GOP47_0012901 [Adiantum capillus-veneris]
MVWRRHHRQRMGVCRRLRTKGHHFRTCHIDERRTTIDCGIMGNFDIDGDKDRYCGTIERTLKVNFRTFHTFILECKWFGNVSRRHENGLYMVDSSMHHTGRSPIS